VKAMIIDRSGATPAIRQGDIEPPSRARGQVLIRVQAASVNRADLAVLAGTHAAPGAAGAPAVVGLDAAGTVVEADEDSGFSVGDRVMTMVGGGLAEYVAIDSRFPVPLPDSWTFEEGAGAIVALMTEHNALRTAGQLRDGDAVLINAANSGVGQMAIQIARHLGAGRIIAGVRTHREDALLTTLGADTILNTGSGEFAEQVLDASDGQGVDIIIDHVGGPYLADHIKAAALQARLIGVGRLGGAEGTLDMEALAFKRVEIIGVTFRTRSLEEKVRIVEAMREDLDNALAAGKLKPRIDRVLPWTEVRSAQTLVAGNDHLGKVILQVET
jgi:NADPH:quinone reductase